jgi:hypothetical protein
MSVMLEIGDAAVVDPVEHLLGAQLGLFGIQPGFGQNFGEARAGADQVHAAILARGDVARGNNRVDVAGMGMGAAGGAADAVLSGFGLQAWARA